MKNIFRKIKKTVLSALYLYGGGMTICVGKFSRKPYKQFKKDLDLLKAQSAVSSAVFPVTSLRPVYSDKEDTAGSLLLHYFYQDLHVAQRIFLHNPATHADVGSRIDGFVAHVASFRKIDVYDVRPLETAIPNVSFYQADMMQADTVKEASVDSLSCLHALEHFGLGRYGDPISFEGYLTGFNTMTRMLKKGGRMYLSVPIGPQRIEFHAHRVFSVEYLQKMVAEHYEIVQFSYIDDNNVFYPNVTLTPENAGNNFGCIYGCGIFELIKLNNTH